MGCGASAVATTEGEESSYADRLRVLRDQRLLRTLVGTEADFRELYSLCEVSRKLNIFKPNIALMVVVSGEIHVTLSVGDGPTRVKASTLRRGDCVPFFLKGGDYNLTHDGNAMCFGSDGAVRVRYRFHNTKDHTGGTILTLSRENLQKFLSMRDYLGSFRILSTTNAASLLASSRELVTLDTKAGWADALVPLLVVQPFVEGDLLLQPTLDPFLAAAAAAAVDGNSVSAETPPNNTTSGTSGNPGMTNNMRVTQTGKRSAVPLNDLAIQNRALKSGSSNSVEHSRLSVSGSLGVFEPDAPKIFLTLVGSCVSVDATSVEGLMERLLVLRNSLAKQSVKAGVKGGSIWKARDKDGGRLSLPPSNNSAAAAIAAQLSGGVSGVGFSHSLGGVSYAQIGPGPITWTYEGDVSHAGHLFGIEASFLRPALGTSTVIAASNGFAALLSLEALEALNKLQPAMLVAWREAYVQKILTGLKSSPLFASVSVQGIRSLAADNDTKLTTLYPGWPVCREGDEADSFYVMVDGEVRVEPSTQKSTGGADTGNSGITSSSSPTATTAIVTSSDVSLPSPTSPPHLQSTHYYLHAGDHYGELAVVSSSPYAATLRTTCCSTLLIISKSAFMRVFGQSQKALIDIKLRARGGETELIDILRHSEGHRLLLEFLKKEFASENLLFWAASDRYERRARKLQKDVMMQNLACSVSNGGGGGAVVSDGNGEIGAREGGELTRVSGVLHGESGTSDGSGGGSFSDSYNTKLQQQQQQQQHVVGDDEWTGGGSLSLMPSGGGGSGFRKTLFGGNKVTSPANFTGSNTVSDGNNKSNIIENNSSYSCSNKSVPSLSSLRQLASDIINEYIVDGAGNQVNIGSAIRDDILRAFSELCEKTEAGTGVGSKAGASDQTSLHNHILNRIAPIDERWVSLLAPGTREVYELLKKDGYQRWKATASFAHFVTSLRQSRVCQTPVRAAQLAALVRYYKESGGGGGGVIQVGGIDMQTQSQPHQVKRGASLRMSASMLIGGV